jgi:tetratricopeptide (TPR) repeat protein
MSKCNYECEERENLYKTLYKFVEENKNLLFEEKVQIYKFAISMTNSSDAMMELAILYEKEESYENAEKYYLMALKFEKDCPILYFNLADMCITMWKKGYWFKKQYALRFFAKGADLNDFDCIFKFIHYSPVNCDKVKFYLSKVIEHPDYKKRRINNFINIISFVKQLDEITEPLPENLAKEKIRLNSLRIVSNYKNKIQLFTKLNHICECPICYEEKLNIDMSCGHCFCTDCYVKILSNNVVSCPICRN